MKILGIVPETCDRSILRPTHEYSAPRKDILIESLSGNVRHVQALISAPLRVATMGILRMQSALSQLTRIPLLNKESDCRWEQW